jgi:hypothetical protein
MKDEMEAGMEEENGLMNGRWKKAGGGWLGWNFWRGGML